MLGPSVSDFIEMLLNQVLSLSHLLRFEAEVRSHFHLRINPELGFTVRMLNVDVSASLLAGEEVKSESSDPKNRWTHRVSLAHAIPIHIAA
jgi:hypothetical protein